MTYREASNYIASTLKDQRAFASSLIMCLDRKSQQRANWKINLKSISKSHEDLFGFHKYGEYDGKVLMLVGKKSFQYEIENDKQFFVSVFPNITNSDIVHFEDAGHWLHFEKQEDTIEKVSIFL